jgi:dolichyl-phosphate mannosyltransferase polypeptide 3
MTRWFTADGYFIAKPFQQWLASEVPVIGAADPNNVVEEIGRGSSAQSNQNFTVNSDNAADILQQLKNSGANTATRTTTRASTMTRAQQTISLAMLLTSVGSVLNPSKRKADS